jgi:NIMA (never in mitosis gene a)-related kinase
MLKLSDFSIKR